MHHVLMDQWSQRSSPLHTRDPRAKILALLAFLIVLATTAPGAFPTLAIDAAVLAAGLLIAGLPPGGLLLRAMAVLPSAIIPRASWCCSAKSPSAESTPKSSSFSPRSAISGMTTERSSRA